MKCLYHHHILFLGFMWGRKQTEVSRVLVANQGPVRLVRLGLMYAG